MEQKYRILGIAPYEGLKNILTRLSIDYPEIELTVFVGDLEEGLEIAKKNFHRNYDAVISRGMTAQLLQQLPIPIVEIEISMYDIMCALNLADAKHKKTAIVSFADITKEASQICEINDYSVDFYTLSSPNKAYEVLQMCKKKGYDSIVCDMVANQAAKQHEMNSYLITSGSDSVRKALNQVLDVCKNIKSLRNENLMLRELIQGQLSQTVLFDDDKNIILSSIDEPSIDLIDMLSNEIEKTIEEPDRRITKVRNGELYSIRAQRIETDNKTCTAFYFTNRKSPLATEKAGIRFYSKQEIEHLYYESMFCFAGTAERIRSVLNKITGTSKPILIIGETGTGKESLAFYLYINGIFTKAPLTVVDCQLLNDKSWEYLLGHSASPLSESNTTIFFQNIDLLSPARSSQLLTALISMEVYETNHVIMSATCDSNGQISKIVSLFADRLCALSVYAPPLREQKDCIPALLNQVLSLLNTDTPNKLAGAEPQAIKVLEEYSWPNNLTQFKRVIGELAITENNFLATSQTVNKIIQKEQHIGYVPHTPESFMPIDLERPLAEIEKDIINRVLHASNDNQTIAAKKLGISRTTLWRIITEK